MSLNLASRRLLAALLTAAFVLAPSVSLAQDETSEPSPSPEPITSPAGDWLVTTFDAWEQGLAEPLPGSTLTLRLLDDGELEGETACGRFTGGWSSEGAELFMGVAATGNLGCAEQPTAEAIGLSTALGAVTSWQATSDGLELRDALGATRVVLEPLLAGEPVGEWTVLQFRRPNGELRAPEVEGPMSMILVDDRIEGDSGCRSLTGAFTQEGSTIALVLDEVEGSVCDDPLARAERQLRRALGEVVYWRQVGDELALLDGFDEPLVELIRTPGAQE
jgi:heat shock protein HslJ